MDLLAADPDPEDVARLDLETTRVCDRLRTMSLVRLRAPIADVRTRAGEAARIAQGLADAAADLADRQRRDLPELPDSAAADMLAVCAHDLAEELRRSPDAQSADVCRRWVLELIDLRIAL
ncbi:MAG: hypothetical protein WCF04_15170 [Candidatus Nanopelagicales bacterium]